jgi:hypothetical protein
MLSVKVLLPLSPTLTTEGSTLAGWGGQRDQFAGAAT